jgi:hypothetical protein
LLNFLVKTSILEGNNGRWSASVRANNLFDRKYNTEYVAGGYVEPAVPGNPGNGARELLEPAAKCVPDRHADLQSSL